MKNIQFWAILTWCNLDLCQSTYLFEEST